MMDLFGNQLRSDIAKAMWQFDHDNYRNGAQHWPDYETAMRVGSNVSYFDVGGTRIQVNIYEAYAHVAMATIDAKGQGK